MLPKKGYYIPRAREMDLVPSIWNNFSEMGIGTQRHHGIRMKAYRAFVFNRTHLGIYPETEWHAVGRHILKKYTDCPAYFPKVWKKNAAIAQETERLVERIRKKYQAQPDLVNARTLVTLKRQWIKFDQINVLPWYPGAEPLRNHIHANLKEKYNLSEQQIETLFTPNTLSLAAQEELCLYRCASLRLNGTALARQAKELSNRFGWMPFGYDGPAYWDESYYSDKLLSLSKKHGTFLLRKAASIEKKLADTISRQQTIIRAARISRDDRRLLDILQKLYIMTDERKQVHFKLHYVYHLILQQLAGATGMSLKDLKYLDADEIALMFSRGQFAKFRKLSQTRQNHPVFAYVTRAGKEMLVTGPKAEKLLQERTLSPEQVGQLTGMTANRTGNGSLTGKARVIMNPREIGRMQKGEILITAMTTPDFVPAMRKAKAIVTDEGGITSHAAIVSRELGIPCIIGTRMATKVFQDGDIIEVDANKGIVKKL